MIVPTTTVVLQAVMTHVLIADGTQLSKYTKVSSGGLNYSERFQFPFHIRYYEY